MRILAVSDMHGELGSLWKIAEHFSPALILCCGDWGDPGQIAPGEYQELLSAFHVLTVFGNHDDLDVLATLRNRDGSSILLENGEVREVNNVRVSGINGIWAKSHRKPWYITSEEVVDAGKRAGEGHADVLLTHGCAVGLNDSIPGGRHGGQRCFLDAFLAASPRIHLCGHLHSQQLKALNDGRITANIGITARGDYVVIEHSGDVWSAQAGQMDDEGVTS
jgi:uncharacterized protein